MRKSIAIILCFFACASSALATPTDDQDFITAMINGGHFQQQHRYRDALRWYEQALRLKPDSWAPYQNAGAMLIQLDDFQGAINILTRGTKVEPKRPEFYCLLSEAHVGLGDPKGALADLNQAIVLQPNCEAYYAKRAEAYEGLGEHDKAIQDYSKAIRLFAPVKTTPTAPANPSDKGMYRLVSERGTVYERTGKFQNAIDDYTTYLCAPRQYQANSLRILQSRAECYDKIGKHDLAAKDRAAAANHKGDVLEDLLNDETIGTGR
ncbi:MAG TPA: tetratricopeptide repeat protein [Planktothrix sp.]|jgi:tetratricopeptide (TPR) repeat protein